jgi:hypothetical protein
MTILNSLQTRHLPILKQRVLLRWQIRLHHTNLIVSHSLYINIKCAHGDPSFTRCVRRSFPSHWVRQILKKVARSLQGCSLFFICWWCFLVGFTYFKWIAWPIREVSVLLRALSWFQLCVVKGCCACRSVGVHFGFGKVSDAKLKVEYSREW